MTEQQKNEWTRIRAGGLGRFMIMRGVLPLTATGLVCIVLFWAAPPAARAETMLDLWYLAPAYAALGLLISVLGWFANERQFRAARARS